MPRKTSDEVLAALRQKVEEAEAKVGKQRQSQIEKIDVKIAAAEARLDKITVTLAELKAQRDVLKQEIQVFEDGQPQAGQPADGAGDQPAPATELTFSATNAEQV